MSVLAAMVWLATLGVAAGVGANLVRFRRAPGAPATAPPVSVLLPVRNEADAVEAAVRAACAQVGDVEVLVLDDESTDATPAILERLARELPRLRVIRGRPLPAGWAGKAWACWQLASEHARHPWLVFVDCDVRLAPDAAGRLLAAALRERTPFVSAFPRQLTKSAGEALLVPLIHLVLLAWLPLGLVNRVSRPSLVAGCGQLMLVERSAYLGADGHRAIRGTLHDGLQLARRMKAAGYAVGILDGDDLAVCRMYAGFAAAWRGFARNAYEALGSPGTLAAMLVLNGGVFLLPFVALPWAVARGGLTLESAAWAGATATVLVLRAALARRFGAPAWTVVATPLAVALMLAIQLHSFVAATLGWRVRWRARTYAQRSTPVMEKG